MTLCAGQSRAVADLQFPHLARYPATVGVVLSWNMSGQRLDEIRPIGKEDLAHILLLTENTLSMNNKDAYSRFV